MVGTALNTDRKIVGLVGAVQFIIVLDFLMVLPLGPDFSAALGISPTKIGMVGAANTFAAAVSGIIAARFLDRFDRRPALAVAMLGMALGGFLGGLAWDLDSLLMSRLLTGLFAGPAMALGLAIIADNIPQERRGRAMGALMGANAAASIIGIPGALELARLFGWRAPFFTITAMGLLVLVGMVVLLGAQRSHLGDIGAKPRLLALLLRRDYRLAYLLPGTVFTGIFMLVPYLAAHLQQNLGFPRDQLWMVFTIAGVLSLFGTRLSGRLTDRYGSTKILTLGQLTLVLMIYLTYVSPTSAIPVLVLFPLFSMVVTFRTVPTQTLVSKVPLPHERAAFMAVLQTVQFGSMGAGAFIASQIVFDSPDGRLGGIDTVGQIAMALCLIGPIMALFIERGVKSRIAEPAA